MLQFQRKHPLGNFHKGLWIKEDTSQGKGLRAISFVNQETCSTAQKDVLNAVD